MPSLLWCLSSVLAAVVQGTMFALDKLGGKLDDKDGAAEEDEEEGQKAQQPGGKRQAAWEQ